MKPTIRLATTGSRHWSDEFLLRTVLNYLSEEYNITLLIHGGADGADTFADDWAKDCGIERKVNLPDYGKYGKRAPLVRNTENVEESDAVVAFRASGKSNGTDDTIRTATAAGKLWLVVNDWREATS